MTKTYLFFISLFLSFCAASQSLVSVNPASANAGQTLNVTITGTNTHFVQTSGTTVNFSFSQTSATSVVNSVNVVNDSVLSANVSVPANVLTGNYNVTATNAADGTLSLNNSFHVNGAIPASLVSISPASGSAGQTLSVTITGARTHFSQAVTNQVNFSFFQTSSTTVVNSVNVVNDSALIANLTIPTNIVTGNYNATVQNSMDGFISLINGFHVNGISQPSITLVNPSVARVGQTLNVTITGKNTHFVQGGGTVVDFTFMQTSGTTVASFVNSINAVNDSSIIANITIPANAVVGNYNVRVFDVADGYLFDDFYIFNNCYSHFATSYNAGNNLFTLTLDSATVTSATGYYWDFGDGFSSTMQTPTHTFIQDTTYNVCLRVKTSALDSCTYCHVIGKNSSGGVVLKQTNSGFLLNVVLNPVTGISESGKNKSDFSIVAIPNPANYSVTISLNPTLDLKDALLSIYDINGALIIEKPVIDYHTTLNISSLSDGLYFIKASTMDGVKTLKFLKQ